MFYALQTRHRLRNVIRVSACLLLFWAAFGRETGALRRSQTAVLPTNTSTLSGIALTAQDLRTTQGTVFDLSVTAADGKQLTHSVAIQVLLPDRREGPSSGQPLRVTGSMALPRQVYNPGEQRWGTPAMQLFLAHDLQLLPVSSFWGRLGQWNKRLCGKVMERARAILSYESFGLLNELLLHRHTFGAADRQVFSLSGTSHLLAISGLHLSLMFALLSTIIGTLLPERSISRTLIPLGLTFLYLVFIDFPASADRAFIMLCVVAFSRYLGKHVSKLESLSWAMVLLVGIDPSSLFDIGLQLSFISVAGLFFLGEPLAAAIHTRNRWTRSLFTSLCATTGASLPATIVAIPVFHSFTPVAFLANIIAIPFISLLLPCLLFLTLLLLLAPPLAGIVAPLFNSLASVFFWFLRSLAHLPGAHWNVATPSAATFMVSSLLFAAVVVRTDNALRMRKHRLASGLLIGALGMLTVLLWFCSPVRCDLRITFPVLEQGSAVIVRQTGGSTWIYLHDTDVTAAERTVRVAAAMGITSPEVVALTGDAADIPDQLDAIFASLSPRQVYLPGIDARAPIAGLEAQFQRTLRDLDGTASLHLERAGVTIDLDQQRLRVMTSTLCCIAAAPASSPPSSFAYDMQTHCLSTPAGSVLSVPAVGCISLFARGSRCWVAHDS